MRSIIMPMRTTQSRRPLAGAAASRTARTTVARLLPAAAVVAAGLGLARGAAAQATLPTGFADQLVVGNLSFPTGMAFLPDGRLLFVEQFSARIRLVVNGALAAVDPVATVPNVEAVNERGLLGIAVDPGFPGRPYVYVHYSVNTNLFIRIARFTVVGDLDFTGDGSLTINTATRYDLIANIPDSAPNHNGGTLRFGTDGMLYASLGEDGQGCAAQDTSGLRGVILRLDVSRLPSSGSGPAPRDLITPPGNPFPLGGLDARLLWAFGLRNPFRFHVDPLNGFLFVGDVGPNQWEELDRVPAGGLDFGWPHFEGPDLNDPDCPLTLAATGPIHSYDRSGMTAAVISAGVYRAPAGATVAFPGEYDGDYFFSDYYLGFLRRLKGGGSSWSVAPPVPGQANPDNWATGLGAATDYLVAPDGSLWYCRQQPGDIRRILWTGSVAVPPAAPPAGIATFSAPYPSPSRGAVRFEYSLNRALEVELAILDLGGRVVRRLVDRGPAEARAYHVAWDGRDDRARPLRAGIYRAQLVAGGQRLERRVAIVR